MVSNEYSEALSEIDDILEHLDIKLLNKIPQRFKDFVSTNKSKTYEPKFDHSKRLNELELKDKTRAILSVIYLNYLCDEEQKNEFVKKLKDNSMKKEEEHRKKYNPNEIFKKDKSIEKIEEKDYDIYNEEKSIIEYKEGFISKIIKRIKKFFHIK